MSRLIQERGCFECEYVGVMLAALQAARDEGPPSPPNVGGGGVGLEAAPSSPVVDARPPPRCLQQLLNCGAMAR